MDRFEYTLRPERQEIPWRTYGRVLLGAYVLTCISVTLATMALYGDPPAYQIVPLEICAVGLGIFAIAGWSFIGLAYVSKRLAHYQETKCPTSFSVKHRTISIRLENRYSFDVTINDVKELCLETISGDTAGIGAGVGIRLANGVVELHQNNGLRKRFEKDRRRHAYDLWIYTQNIGMRSQVASFWEWLNTLDAEIKCKKVDKPGYLIRRMDWIFVVLATIWASATITSICFH